MDALERTLPPTRRVLGDVDLAQPLDPTCSLTDGLQGFWLPLPRHVGGSRLYDLSGRGLHIPYSDGTPVFSSKVWSSTPVADLRGLSGAFVRPNSNETEQDGDFSVFVRFQRTGNPNARQGIFVDVRFDGSSDNGGYLIDYRGDENGQYRFGVFNDGLTTAQHEDPTTEPQTLCGASDGSKIRLYQDGSQVASASSLNPGAHATADLKIGASGGKLEFPFEGHIQSALLFKRTLSPSEVEYLNIQSRRGFPDLLRRRDSVGLLGGGTSVIADTDVATASLRAEPLYEVNLTVEPLHEVNLTVEPKLDST